MRIHGHKLTIHSKRFPPSMRITEDSWKFANHSAYEEQRVGAYKLLKTDYTDMLWTLDL